MKLKKLFFLFLTGALLCVGTPGTTHAGAFDQLVGMAGGSVPNVPDVPDPTPVYEGSSSSNDDSSNNGPTFWDKFWSNETTPEERAYQEQQREKRRQIRAEKAKKRKEAAKRRRWAREDREEAEQKRKAAAEAKRFPKYVSPPRAPRALPPSLKPPVTDVPAGTEAKALTENQFRMATLLKKPSLTAQEQQLLQQLNDACRKLWAKAVQNENQSALERAKIKLSLPVLDFKDSQIVDSFKSQLAEIKNARANAQGASLDLIKKYNREKFQQLAEQETGDMMETVVEGGQGAFENLSGATKISVAISQGDIPRAGKETLDFLVGKLSSPQAGMAVEGGRIYSDVAFKSLDNFMVKAMGAVGQNFDTQEFWKNIREEMNVGQKTVMEFIGGPDGK